MLEFSALDLSVGLAFFAPCPREFDARLIHMHGPVMTCSRRSAAVLLPWRAAAATCDDSV